MVLPTEAHANELYPEITKGNVDNLLRALLFKSPYATWKNLDNNFLFDDNAAFLEKSMGESSDNEA